MFDAFQGSWEPDVRVEERTHWHGYAPYSSDAMAITASTVRWAERGATQGWHWHGKWQVLSFSRFRVGASARNSRTRSRIDVTFKPAH